MDITSKITSPQVVYLASTMGKIMPPSWGYLLGKIGARLISLTPSLDIHRVVRTNQWVVHNCDLSKAELDRRTYLTTKSIGECLYDYFHYRNSPEKTKKIIRMSPETRQIIDFIKQGRGLLIAALHTSNYDLGFETFCAENCIQILSTPNPHQGYDLQNKLRSQSRLNVTPLSMSSFIQAKKYLLKGGSVLTGIDRPGTNTRYTPRFFGYASSLPVGYIRLAIETNVPIVVMGCKTNVDRTYTLVSSDLFSLEKHSDLHSELVENAETVLRFAESFIRLNPSQWAMIYRVWPDMQTPI